MTFATLTITFSHCIYFYCCWSVFKLELHQLSFPKMFSLTRSIIFIARKRSLGQGTVFTHVCHFTRWGSLYDVTSCLDAPCSFLGSLCLWSHVPSRGSLCKEGWWSLGVSVQGGLWSSLCPGDVSDRCLRTVKSDRYASYWNAFLYLKT